MLESERKNAVVCGLGNMAVWCCYSLFMPFFVILSGNFFPKNSKFLSMLLGFIVFGLGLFFRPVGSLIFGKIGDKFSREKSIASALYLMAFSTAAIAVIPAYNSCGVLSTLALVVTRILQGIAMGGASAISMVHIVELFPENRKCLGGATSQAGMLVGIAISSLLFSLSTCFSGNFLSQHGWRFAFLFGLILIPFSKFNLSVKNFEAPKVRISPTSEIFKTYKVQFLEVVALTAFTATCFYTLFAFLPNYMLINYPIKSIFISHFVNIFAFLMILISGFFGDRFGCRSVLLVGAIFALIGSTLCAFLTSGEKEVKCLMLVLSISISIFYGGSSKFYSLLFPKHVRCTAVALSMSFSQAIFGGLAPILATSLTKFNFSFLVIPIAFVSVLALLFLLLKRE